MISNAPLNEIAGAFLMKPQVGAKAPTLAADTVQSIGIEATEQRLLVSRQIPVDQLIRLVAAEHRIANHSVKRQRKDAPA